MSNDETSSYFTSTEDIFKGNDEPIPPTGGAQAVDVVSGYGRCGRLKATLVACEPYHVGSRAGCQLSAYSCFAVCYVLKKNHLHLGVTEVHDPTRGRLSSKARVALCVILASASRVDLLGAEHYELKTRGVGLHRADGVDVRLALGVEPTSLGGAPVFLAGAARELSEVGRQADVADPPQGNRHERGQTRRAWSDAERADARDHERSGTWVHREGKKTNA